MHLGKFAEDWEIQNGTDKLNLSGMSGRTIVMPASKILALIDIPQFVQAHQEIDASLPRGQLNCESRVGSRR